MVIQEIDAEMYEAYSDIRHTLHDGQRQQVRTKFLKCLHWFYRAGTVYSDVRHTNVLVHIQYHVTRGREKSTS